MDRSWSLLWLQHSGSPLPQAKGSGLSKCPSPDVLEICANRSSLLHCWQEQVPGSPHHNQTLWWTRQIMCHCSLIPPGLLRSLLSPGSVLLFDFELVIHRCSACARAEISLCHLLIRKWLMDRLLINLCELAGAGRTWVCEDKGEDSTCRGQSAVPAC